MSLRFSLIAAACILLVACEKQPAAGSSRVTLEYWDKWTGFEADAMRGVVDDFNKSQDRITVDYTSISQFERKLMLAVAGKVPPDIAGVYANDIPVFSENNALMPLDRPAAEAGIKREDYIDVFWQLCTHRDHLWALPSTPASIALIWNKKMFRDAGLDPNRPPRSIAELEEFNEKLVRRKPDGSLSAMGNFPEEPGWYDALWGYWFGGRMWDGVRNITADSPENVAAYRWIQSYPERFGADRLLRFNSGFGNFASGQNPFFTGKVAMVLQGVWIYNFISKYAPADFDWGVAAFPSNDPAKLPEVSLVDVDGLVIPAGCRHPKEAFEFIHYVNTQGPMEKLCLAQLKFSPLKNCTPEFFARHPNPHIRDFLALAKSPNARYFPRLTTWLQYTNDMKVAVGNIWDGKATAEEALAEVQKREQPVLDRRVARWDRIGQKLEAEWSKE